MAAPVSKATLKITYEALVERNELLMGDQPHPVPHGTVENGSDYPDKSRTNGVGSTRGILYLPPTIELSTKEKQRRRTTSRQDRTRSQRRPQPSDHAPTTRTQDKTKRSKSKQENKGSEWHEKVVQRSENGGYGDGADKAGWNQHEHRRVEKALSKWSGDLATLKPVITACQCMQDCMENMLGRDMEAVSKQDISTKLWKQGHYCIIEALRDRISMDCSVKDALETFLADSIAFYSKLLGRVESQLSFKVSALLSNRVEFTSKTHCRKVMLAAILCHHWSICLGDLSRYQQQQQYSLAEDADWSKPRRYYQQAQQLVPKAGKPYNQLAVIAINTHRRLDAIYYYMRSLSTKPAFQSAYDSLVGIFADTSRKAEKLEEDERRTKKRREAEAARKLKRAEQRQRKKQARQRKLQNHQECEAKGRGTVVQEFVSGKREVWIMPGVSRYEQEKLQSHGVSQDAGAEVSHDEPESPTSMSSPPQVLVRKMTLTFVQIHGKLFTRTGLERLAETIQHMLRYCGELWRVGGRLRVEYALLLIKMTSINIFAIHHAVDMYADNPSAQVHHCGVGLTLALQVATVLLAACVVRLETTPIATPTESAEWVELLDYFAVLLPAVRVFLDWFLRQTELRSMSVTAVKQPILLEFWTALVKFLNLTSEVARPGFQGATPTTTTTTTRLWEERSLAGFIHLKATLSTKDTFTIPDVKRMSGKEHQEQSVARVALLNRLCRGLCETVDVIGIRGATLSFNDDSKQFSLLDADASGVQVEAGPEGVEKGEGEGGGEGGSQSCNESFELGESSFSFGFTDSSDEDVEVLSDSEEGEEKGVESEGDGTTAGMEMASIAQGVNGEENSEIEQLKAKRDDLVKQMEENTLARAVAKTVLSEAASKARREVFITPKYLVPDTNCFVKMLPSIKTLVERAEFVVAVPLIVVRELEGLSKGTATSGAKQALDYIHASFQAKVPYLRALTTQGSLLATLTFRDQLTEKATNDDLILDSCLQLHIKTTTTKPGDHGTEYKVVMLTGDRNLRVKAHASNLPVKDIPNFMTLLSK